MKAMPKFNAYNPQNDEEKLILELKKYLGEVTETFINLNINKFTDNQIFKVVRDGTLAYVGDILESFNNVIIGKDHQNYFIEENINIFMCYMEEIRKKNER